MPVVTIRGQLGGGATEVGQLVASRIRGQYVDREIIERVASRVKRGEEEIVIKEQPPGSRLGQIFDALANANAMGGGMEGAYVPSWEVPLDDTRYLETLTTVIRNLARAPAIVIRGRGSQFILRDHPRAFHVLLVAPREIRVKQVMEELQLSEGEAAHEIDRVDGSRRAFIKRYFNENLDDPLHYHLVVNTGAISHSGVAHTVIDTIAFEAKRTGRR